jgi:hypothetical protein
LGYKHIILIFLHGLGRLTCSGIDAFSSFPGASTISSPSRFVVEGVFRKSGDPPKENKGLKNKDAQPWISADQMTKDLRYKHTYRNVLSTKKLFLQFRKKHNMLNCWSTDDVSSFSCLL